MHATTLVMKVDVEFAVDPYHRLIISDALYVVSERRYQMERISSHFFDIGLVVVADNAVSHGVVVLWIIFHQAV